MRPITSRIELSATPRTSVSGLAVLNRNFDASLMRQNTATSMSMMFSSPVSIRLSASTSRPELSWPVSTLPPGAGAEADFGAVDAGNGRQLHLFDRPGDVPMQTGRRPIVIGAETQNHALLVGLHAIEAAGDPKHDDRQQQQNQATAVGEPAEPAAAGTTAGSAAQKAADIRPAPARSAGRGRAGYRRRMDRRHRRTARRRRRTGRQGVADHDPDRTPPPPPSPPCSPLDFPRDLGVGFLSPSPPRSRTVCPTDRDRRYSKAYRDGSCRLATWISGYASRWRKRYDTPYRSGHAHAVGCLSARRVRFAR